MRLGRILCPVICLLVALPVAADHHKSHSFGPNGGFLVALGDGGYQVELGIRAGDTVTARVLGKDHQPVATNADHLTLTFTEPDGEKEDYEIAADGAGFLRKSAHLVQHVVRDPMSIKVTVGGKEYSSGTFACPLGPNGGQLISLTSSEMHAELVVDGDLVRVHLLNKRKRPARVDAKVLTLTFTEKDGETEDYQIPVAKGKSKGTVFQLDDDHVVKHVKRDKITIKLEAADGQLTSKTFSYLGK